MGNPANARYTHSLGENAVEKFQNVYLDEFCALAIYYKEKFQGVLSLDFSEPNNLTSSVTPLVVQLQGVKRGSLQWKINVLEFLLNFTKEVFFDSFLFLQSAAHNMYRSVEAMRASRFPSRHCSDEELAKHVVPHQKLINNYDWLAQKLGFLLDSESQNYFFWPALAKCA